MLTKIAPMSSSQMNESVNSVIGTIAKNYCKRGDLYIAPSIYRAESSTAILLVP